MGYLSHIIVAVTVVFAADFGLESGWVAPWAVVFLLPLPHLLGRAAHKRALAGRFRQAAALARIVGFSAPLLFVAAVAGLGWQGSVREWFGPPEMDWPEPALFVSLAPFLLLELVAIDARARLTSASPAAIARARRFQTRMFLSGVVPLSLYLLVAGLLALDDTVRAHVEEVAFLHVAFAGASIGLFALVLPIILRNTWETRPLERGMARSVLEAVARRAEFRCKGLYQWQTGNLVANAAIVGFLPRNRSVFFSDSLLAQLPPRELCAVFAHEIGHAKRHHVLVMGAWTLVFFLVGDLLLGSVLPETDLAFGLVALGLAGAWYLLLGYLSRRFELDADIVSSEITGDVEALVRALEEVGGAHAHQRASWRHFGTGQRVLFLRALAREPEVGRRLRRALGRWTWLGLGLFAVTLVLEVVSLASSVPADLVRVELRLGRYDRALMRTEDRPEGDELAALARRAARAAGEYGRLTTRELDELAATALASADLDAAYAWLELGARRGLSRHLEALRALDDLSSAGAPSESALRELARAVSGPAQ